MNDDVRETLKFINNPEAERGAPGPREMRETDSTEVELLDAYSRAVLTVVEAVGPAVVGILVGREPAEDAYLKTAAGSGILITPDGYLLTNDHVVHQAEKLSATLADGSRLSATLVGTDPGTDLALIRAEGLSLPYATLGDSSLLRAGQLVIAIGNPLGFQSTV